MTDTDIIKAFDILDKFELFGGQRSSRELWFNKPTDIQNKDIGRFLRDIDFLKAFINCQKAEIERLNIVKKEYQELYDELKKENDVLREDNHILATEYTKKQLERLKKEALIDSGYEVLQLGTIDKLVKELEGKEQ